MCSPGRRHEREGGANCSSGSRPANREEDNLAYLCLKHHSLYDSKTSQHKNYTEDEVRTWRNELYRRTAGKPEETKTEPIASPSADQIRRQRDVENLRALLKTIHWPTLDDQIEEMPYTLVGRVFYFWEGFHETYRGSLFHLHDASLALEIEDFHRFWQDTVSHGESYRPLLNGNYVFRKFKRQLAE
jgi:hypothetical protein